MAPSLTTAWTITTVIALAGWIVSYRLGLTSGRLRAKEELQARRVQMASALLTELRTLEQFMHRLRANLTPLKADWVVPAPYLMANFDRLDILPPTAVLPLLSLHGKLSDISIYRERHPSTEEHTPLQNWYIRLNATFCAHFIAQLKPLLLEVGGAAPTPLPHEVILFPNLPDLPPVAFPEAAYEYDEAGNLVAPILPDQQ